jgi:hypothetical protein
MLMDDYSAHKTNNVWNVCWSHGYIRIVHGGGTTPVGQTCDTDLNEHVRREYGQKESQVLLEKMRGGQAVPKLTHEECLTLMFEVLSDPAVHIQAAQGYKYVGQSVELHGREDTSICREAGVYWNEQTTDKFATMRQRIDVELAAVADEFHSKRLTWCPRDVKRLIGAYPANKKVDRVLETLGDEFYHDDVHCLANGDDDTAVAEGGDDAISASSEENDEDDEPAEHVMAAVAGEGVEGAESAGLEGSIMEQAPLSADVADEVHKVKDTIACLEGHLAGLRAMGLVKCTQNVETELNKAKRRLRELVRESPAVADAFLRLRRAHDQDSLVDARMAALQKDRKRAAAAAVAERNAAVAELKETKRKIQDFENISECRQAFKSFTLEALGKGSVNAGGAKGRNSRYEVLERLKRIGAGLSPGQKNDWLWFKESWDREMVEEYGVDWASKFASWIQNLLDDDRSNAFSTFVYTETCRVFSGIAALNVPGQ